MTRPWSSTNLAISADGKISSIDHRPSGWTSATDHQRLLDLRRNVDAIIVGKGTLVADRMTLTVPGISPAPLRCIVSSKGNLPADHPIFQKSGGAIHLLATSGKPDAIPSTVTLHEGSLAEFLEILSTKLGVSRLHCEGGGQLIASLAEIDAIDEFHLTLAGHTLFGGKESPTTTGIPKAFLPRSLDFELSHFDPQPDLGECFVSYRRKSAQ